MSNIKLFEATKIRSQWNAEEEKWHSQIFKKNDYSGNIYTFDTGSGKKISFI